MGIAALSAFKSVKRRMEKVAEVNGITIYDDFAHHPTAIATTLDGLRKRVGDAPVIAIIEPRSNSMKLGAHRDGLPQSVATMPITWSGMRRPIWAGTWRQRLHRALCRPSIVCDSLDAIIERRQKPALSLVPTW
jgi:UDP-N-acetylmuramate: L-alanyl-gamma-D-glutamyl-meso-diaminopimelate ligase